MHSNLRRLPAEQAPHKKRLPSQSWESRNVARQLVIGGTTFTGPITITTVIPVNPTTIPANILTSASATLSSSSIASSSSSVTSSSSSTTAFTTSAFTPVAPSMPVASAIASPSATGKSANSNSDGVSAVSTQHGLPTGVIIGITIVCVILLLGAILFFIRQRAMRSRRQARQSMVAWQTARPTTAGVPPMSAGMTQQATPGVSFAQLQAAALPQPMASTYNNPVPPPQPIPAPLSADAGAASARVVFEFIPTLPDELSITTGEIVRLVNEFDDGWALCANARGEQGMVPLECLNRVNSVAAVSLAPGNYRNSRRTSSRGV